MEDNRVPQELEDDSREKVTLMIEHRLPWLFVGLVGGILATFLSSRFSALLERNIELAFFIPVIVYMAAAVGSQTQSVYVRNLGRDGVRLKAYLLKEIALGTVVGGLFGLSIGIFSYLWFGIFKTSLSIGFSMFLTMSFAPVVALLVPTIIQKEHKDPAVGSGPFTNLIQDLISLSVYFAIATFVISS